MHIVKSGDTMWKIAVQYEVGVAEIINANPQVKNPDLIYPGQVLAVPGVDKAVLDFESEVIRLVNEARAENGLPALKTNWELSRVARYKSQDMKDKRYFSHTSPTYGSPFTMMKNFGITYRSAGENIAKGQRTPAAVVQAWMNSQGHRANILNKSFTEIGVGYVADGNYWTQMFIGR
ncbi:MAG: SafA/ExsA family spore coat assembly protein [Ruminococcaceae bacterium]|nr:SafA/ExsA family spore coat assembly protein [Oscillospiraceae bacterium]